MSDGGGLVRRHVLFSGQSARSVRRQKLGSLVKQSHKTLLLWVLLILMFLVIWQFLSPTDRKPPVAFSDFVNQVHPGSVDEIHIKDREYSFRTHTTDSNKTVAQHESVGPMADSDLISTLKPDNKDTPPPRIFFIKRPANVRCCPR